ncbi:MAG: L,D-transpeptidase [Saprospiraceae bacterium]|nr:L,D-transpeptidase [Saprospiraceae bacterium]
MRKKRIIIVAAILLAALLIAGAVLLWRKAPAEKDSYTTAEPVGAVAVPEPPLQRIPVDADIPVAAFFRYIDGLVARYDTLTPYPLSEHLIVRANAWIIDTLESTDYYRRMARGLFVADQRKEVVLKKGDTLLLPGRRTADSILAAIRNTLVDVNIPAFRLRIMQGDSVLYSFPVRVGKDRSRFLVMAGGMVDLRTRTGSGEIIRISRDPAFYDPVTGKPFQYTRRDDGKTTRMPLIPWIEPSLDGMRYGQLIHPTTNPVTLGKAASNGCIGVREADAWRIYYHAPVGTKVKVRYDLTEIGPQGDTLRFPDVYHYREKGRLLKQYASLGLPFRGLVNRCWCLP